jgi:L-iditol 2-dehydrogenase
VAVVGAGAIGLLAVAVLALHSPRQLIVIEPNTVRREVATRLGASTTIDPTDESFASVIADLTDGSGVDVVVEAAGTSATVRTAIDIIRHGGVVVWLGNAGRTIEIDEFKVVWKQLTLVASVGMTRQSVRRAISLIAQGEIATQEVISDVIPLSDGVAAFHRQARNNDVVKTILLP